MDSANAFATDPANFYQVIDAGADNALQAAKLPQQLAPSLRPKTRDFLEPRRLARFGAPLAVPGDREAMRFVANLLNQ